MLHCFVDGVASIDAVLVDHLGQNVFAGESLARLRIFGVFQHTGMGTSVLKVNAWRRYFFRIPRRDSGWSASVFLKAVHAVVAIDFDHAEARDLVRRDLDSAA